MAMWGCQDTGGGAGVSGGPWLKEYPHPPAQSAGFRAFSGRRSAQKGAQLLPSAIVLGCALWEAPSEGREEPPAPSGGCRGQPGAHSFKGDAGVSSGLWSHSSEDSPC